MHGRFAAAVPIAMWNACWEYHKSSRTGLISLTLDLQAHGAAEDVEQLVDQRAVAESAIEPTLTQEAVHSEGWRAISSILPTPPALPRARRWSCHGPFAKSVSITSSCSTSGIYSPYSRSSCTTTAMIALIARSSWKRQCQIRRYRVATSLADRSWAAFTTSMRGRHERCTYAALHLLLGGFPDLPRETTSFYFYSAGGTRPVQTRKVNLLLIPRFRVRFPARAPTSPPNGCVIYGFGWGNTPRTSDFRMRRSRVLTSPESEEPGAHGSPGSSFRFVRGLSSSPAAAQQANEPDDGQYDDANPEQVDQRARRVEQQPEHEKDDRGDDEHVDHFFGSPPDAYCRHGASGAFREDPFVG